jgi:hypothetical protein
MDVGGFVESREGGFAMLLISDTMTAETGTLLETDGHTERRRGLRIRQARPIKVYEPTTSRYFGGQTGDISATGLRVELPAFAPVRVGETLSIHVGLNPNGQTLANRRAMIPARVVCVSRTPRRTSGTLEAGVEFLASIAAHLDAA